MHEVQTNMYLKGSKPRQETESVFNEKTKKEQRQTLPIFEAFLDI